MSKPGFVIASDFQTLLNVADVEASLAFYARLGFEAVEKFEQENQIIWAQIRSGEAVLMLNQQDRISAADRSARPDFGDAVFYITVPDAATAHAMLAAAGIDAPQPERQMYGVDEFRLRDPDGYELAIASRPNGKTES